MMKKIFSATIDECVFKGRYIHAKPAHSVIYLVGEDDEDDGSGINDETIKKQRYR